MRLRPSAIVHYRWRDLAMMQFHDGNRPPPPALNALYGEDPPGWALGLRKLYRRVAEEPLPSDFAELLARCESMARRGSAH